MDIICKAEDAELDPSIAHELLFREMMKDENSIKENIEEANKYSDELDKKDNMYLTLNGLIEFYQGNYEKSVSFLKHPDLTDACSTYHLGLAYLELGDTKKAVEQFNIVMIYSGPPELTSEIVRNQAEKFLVKLEGGG